MMMKSRLITFFVSLAVGLAILAPAVSYAVDEKMEKRMKLLRMLDTLDSQDFQDAIDVANSCTARRNFNCAREQLGKAKKLASGSREKSSLSLAYSNLQQELEQVRMEEERARQEELARIERERRYQEQLRLAREEAARRKRQEEESSGIDWLKAGAMAVGAYAGGLGKMDSQAQSDALTSIMQDSQRGVSGVSNFNNSMNSTAQRYNSQTSSPGAYTGIIGGGNSTDFSSSRRSVEGTAGSSPSGTGAVSRRQTSSSAYSPPNKMANIINNVNIDAESMMLREQCVEQCFTIEDKFEATGCANRCYSKFKGKQTAPDPFYSPPSAIAE